MSDARIFAQVIGGALIAGFLGALAALFVIPIPEENRDLVTYMLGQLSGFAGGIIAYHYASKAGERATDELKTETLAQTVQLARETLAAAPADRPRGTPDDPIATEEVR